VPASNEVHTLRHFPMATWRNGSAFGFDRRRHQKVAGSSPAVVIFYVTFLLSRHHVTSRASSRHYHEQALPGPVSGHPHHGSHR
jgi:hypothetical protein